MSKFIPNIAAKTHLLRELLVQKNQWAWEKPQVKAFQNIKESLVRSPVLALFNPNYETIVSADASSYGFGAVLLQPKPSAELKPVAFVSRSMTNAEVRYAQIDHEKEALAFTWYCDRLSDYLVGLKFHIYTDHMLLVPLFSSNKLDELSLRVQRFWLRMLQYNY